MHPIWRLLIFLAIVVALSVASNLAITALLPHADDTTLFLVRDLKDFLVFLVASWIMARIEGRTIADYGLPWRRMFRGEFWRGILIGFACISVLLLALRVAGVFALRGMALHGVDIARWAVIYGLVFLLVALREEFRNRGYALVTLSAIIGFWPASLVISAIFGIGHLSNHGENWGETYFYGVADSGHAAPPGHLLQSATAGPAWLAGGTVGPEGSVMCTLVIGITWLFCAWRSRPTPPPSPSDPPPLPARSA